MHANTVQIFQTRENARHLVANPTSASAAGDAFHSSRTHGPSVLTAALMVSVVLKTCSVAEPPRQSCAWAVPASWLPARLQTRLSAAESVRCWPALTGGYCRGATRRAAALDDVRRRPPAPIPSPSRPAAILLSRAQCQLLPEFMFPLHSQPDRPGSMRRQCLPPGQGGVPVHATKWSGC
jgi:hypothetical protein